MPEGAPTGTAPHGPPPGVVAVVLTHLRPRLAGSTVRWLLDVEGFSPDAVLVVVNGEGGLDDPALEAAVRVFRLPGNTGPGGGFRAAMEVAFADDRCRWAYLCEDDVTLQPVPAPRVARLVAAVERGAADGVAGGQPVGAVVAFGRRFDHRGHTHNVVPPVGQPFAAVEVTAWGATLLSRRAVDLGVWPDPAWFFGFEDFDFFCRLRKAGLAVVVDGESARAVAGQQTSVGRQQALAAARPTDQDEPWRAYYLARNFFILARRHGSPRWLAWHLAFSVRRLQLAHGGAERWATVRGLAAGARGRLGAHPTYRRRVGELPSATPAPANPVT